MHSGHQIGAAAKKDMEHVVVCVCKDASVKYVQGRVRGRMNASKERENDREREKH